MCEIAIKLLEIMKPFVENIEQDLNDLTEKEKELDTINNIISTIGDDSTNILKIDDNKIIVYLEKFKSNKLEYDANKYILNALLDEVKNLPQYIDAKKYIDNFGKFLFSYYINVDEEYQLLKKEYDKKEIIKKYYNMIENNNVFVNDLDELQELFLILDLSLEEKNNALIYILKENNKVYGVVNKSDLFTDDDKFKVIRLLEENNNYKNIEYNELLDAVSEYVDINGKISDIITDDLVEKINICNILLAKKVHLYRKISFLYYNMNCQKCNKLIEEYECVDDLYEKTKNIKEQEEILRIIKGEL